MRPRPRARLACAGLAACLGLAACGGDGTPERGAPGARPVAGSADRDWEERGRAAAARGDFEGASAAYRQLVAARPDDAGAHNELGRTLIVQARLFAEHEGEETGAGSVSIGQDSDLLDEGIAALRRASELEPGNAEHLYWLGRALHVRGEDEQAIEVLERTVALAPQHAPAHKRLGIAYFENADRARALESFRRAEALDPRDPGIPFQLGNLLLEEDPAAARDAFLRAIERDVAFAPAHGALVGVLARLGDAEGASRAQEAFERWRAFEGRLAAARHAAAKRPDSLDDQLDLADLLFEKRDWAAAGEAYARAVALDARNPYPHLRLGVLLLRMGEPARARQHLEEVLFLAPSALEPRFELLRACAALGDGARTAELVAELAEAGERLSTADRLSAARTLLEVGEAEAAAAHFRGVLATDPENAAAAEGLARAGADSGGGAQ